MRRKRKRNWRNYNCETVEGWGKYSHGYKFCNYNFLDNTPVAVTERFKYWK